MTDPVTAPTPDDLARGWVEKNLPALRPTDGSYRQPVALCMQDAFRAGFAAAVERAADVCDREAVAAGARCAELERVGRANGWPDNVRADYSTWCLIRDSAKAHAARIRKLAG